MVSEKIGYSKECYIEMFLDYRDAELWTSKIVENMIEEGGWTFTVSIAAINNKYRAAVIGQKEQMEFDFDAKV